VRQQLLGHDFTDITDGGLGYQTGKEIDNPLKAWLEDRGLGDIPMIVRED
jgi:hypothetical protein